VGLFLGIAGAENALNNDIFKIVSYISSRSVEIDPTDVIAEALPQDVIVTIAPYRVEGVSDVRRVIPFFEPIVTAVTTVAVDEVELTLHTDITPERLYRVFGTLVQDLNENVMDEQSIEFTTEPCGAPDARRLSNWGWLRFLPEHNLEEDSTGDLERMLRVLNEPTDLLLCDVDRFPEIYDIDLIPDHLLDFLLAHLGNPFTFAPELSSTDKRRLAAVLEEIYQRKGEEFAIESVVNFILNISVDVRPYLGERPTWVLGESELGIDTFLGPGTSFLRFSFEVEAFINLDETTRRRLIEIVQYMKPAHTHFVRLIEPTLPETSVDEAPPPVPP
jgi:phage tail-like protein